VWLGRDDGVDLLCHLMHLPGQVGVGLEFLLLSDEIVIGLLLLERRLPVLPDHDEGRQENRHTKNCQAVRTVAHARDSPSRIRLITRRCCVACAGLVAAGYPGGVPVAGRAGTRVSATRRVVRGMQPVKAYGRNRPSTAEMPARLRRGLIAAGFRASRPGQPATKK
jgi:hypothetical protein